MAFSFKVSGSLYSLIAEMQEIERKAHEESVGQSGLHIEKQHLLDNTPYIIVTCQDEAKGKRLFERVQSEAPRFLKLDGK